MHNIEERFIINASRIAIIIVFAVGFLAICELFSLGAEKAEAIECQYWQETEQIHEDWQIKQCHHVGVL